MSTQVPPITTTVSHTQAPPATSPNPTAPAGSPQAGAGSGAEDLAAIKAELETLKGRVAESDRNAQFWYDKATSAKPAPQPAPAATDDDDKTDVLDVITTKGVKGLGELVDKVAKKRGWVSREEAETLVNSKAAQLTTEQQLLKDYPDLADKSSEFFQSTAQVYGELKKSGIPDHLAMEMAVERTELSFIRSGKHKTPQQQKDDDKAQREADRLARIKAQSGDRGNRQPEGAEDDDELTPEQKHIAAAMGITEEAYKARAKQGVRVRGGMR